MKQTANPIKRLYDLKAGEETTIEVSGLRIVIQKPNPLDFLAFVEGQGHGTEGNMSLDYAIGYAILNHWRIEQRKLRQLDNELDNMPRTWESNE